MVLALTDRMAAGLPVQNKKHDDLHRVCANPRCADPSCNPGLAEQLAIGDITAETYLALAPPAELILSDEPEMESPAHLLQLMLLMSSFMWLYQDRSDLFFAGNTSIFWTLDTLKKRKLRGPDFFLVQRVKPKKRRNSWVVWAEDGRFPDLIIELLSRKTATKDRTEKRELYQNVFRTPEYFWFHPNTKEFMGLRLHEGEYVEIAPDSRGFRWSNVLQLYLGVVDGTLRLLNQNGTVVPTMDEAEHQARVEAEARLKRALAKLRELGEDEPLDRPGDAG